MSTFKLTWKAPEILKAVALALDSTAIKFDIELRKSITSPVWAWPRGESPRDIVDTGALRDSQKFQRLNAREVEYKWEVKYAMIVRNGSTHGGTVSPGRHWDELAILNTRIPEFFANSFKINYK